MFITPRQAALAYIERLRVERPECYNNPAFFTAKLAEEVGEAVKEGNKRLGFHREPGDLEKEAEELADVLICAYGQAIMAGIDVNAAIQKKHHELQSRSWRNT